MRRDFPNLQYNLPCVQPPSFITPSPGKKNLYGTVLEAICHLQQVFFGGCGWGLCYTRSITYSIENTGNGRAFASKQKRYKPRQSMDLTLIVKRIFVDLKASIKDGDSANPDYSAYLLLLDGIFGNLAMDACQLVDRKCVKCLESASGRRIFEVIDQNNISIEIIGMENCCNCDNYVKCVLIDRSEITCKHVLAVWLANAVGKLETQLVPDSRLTESIKRILSP